jgi:formylglycine-generating enzyme required for sulfatase activity
MTGKCSIDEKLEKVVDTTVLDLLEQRLLTFGSRSRYDSAQLFERLGGDLEKLKKNEDRKDELQREISELKREIQHTQKELMQAQGNCQSLENDHKQLIAKNTQLISENTRLISEKNQIEKILKQQIKDDDQKFEKRLKDQSEQIQRLQNELKQLKTQSQIVSYSVGQLKNIALSEVEFNMVYCPVGDFWMGTDDTNLRTDYWKRSKPKHKVKINKGFWIGETQVTQELWEKVMGWNPSHFQGSLKLPVESITWYDCLVFCNRLSELEGFTSCFSLTLIEKDGNHIKKANVEWLRNANGYRLPTEAEWEYAAKAGTDLIYSGSNDLDEIAWYHVNSGEKRLNESLWSEVNESWDKYLEKLKENKNQTHEVKIKKSNAWGLYDMSGNVWEWCMDQWNETIYQNRKNGTENPILWNNEPSTHTVRGGSYGNRADRSRVANRSWDIAEDRNDYRGFRLLRCDP